MEILLSPRSDNKYPIPVLRNPILSGIKNQGPLHRISGLERILIAALNCSPPSTSINPGTFSIKNARGRKAAMIQMFHRGALLLTRWRTMIMTMTLTINVTQEDIRSGQTDSELCPIALALLRAVRDQFAPEAYIVEVGRHSGLYFSANGKEYITKGYSASVDRFIDEFDAGRNVMPMSTVAEFEETKVYHA
jgi:hypothetical protein